jgi:hypothetical protein
VGHRIGAWDRLRRALTRQLGLTRKYPEILRHKSNLTYVMDHRQCPIPVPEFVFLTTMDVVVAAVGHGIGLGVVGFVTVQRPLKKI